MIDKSCRLELYITSCSKYRWFLISDAKTKAISCLDKSFSSKLIRLPKVVNLLLLFLEIRTSTIENYCHWEDVETESRKSFQKTGSNFFF
jgi:hypothetical protein